MWDNIIQSPVLPHVWYNYETRISFFLTTRVANFNVIFETGIFLPTWCKGVIVPVFKKGDSNDTDKYRGITLMSCYEVKILHNFTKQFGFGQWIRTRYFFHFEVSLRSILLLMKTFIVGV